MSYAPAVNGWLPVLASCYKHIMKRLSKTMHVINLSIRTGWLFDGDIKWQKLTSSKTWIERGKIHGSWEQQTDLKCNPKTYMIQLWQHLLIIIFAQFDIWVSRFYQHFFSRVGSLEVCLNLPMLYWHFGCSRQTWKKNLVLLLGWWLS